LLETLQGHITGACGSSTFAFQFKYDTSLVAPNGIMYVRSDVRKGLLARMLSELLDTRVMVKQAMKGVSGDKVTITQRAVSLVWLINFNPGSQTRT